jgi:hypothetical protein
MPILEFMLKKQIPIGIIIFWIASASAVEMPFDFGGIVFAPGTAYGVTGNSGDVVSGSFVLEVPAPSDGNNEANSAQYNYFKEGGFTISIGAQALLLTRTESIYFLMAT